MLLDLTGGGGGKAFLFTSGYGGASRSLPGLSSKGGGGGGKFVGGGGKSISQLSELSSDTAGDGSDRSSTNFEFEFFSGFFLKGFGGGGGGGGGTEVTKTDEQDVFSGSLDNDPVDGGAIDGSRVAKGAIFGIVKLFVCDSSLIESAVAAGDTYSFSEESGTPMDLFDNFFMWAIFWSAVMVIARLEKSKVSDCSVGDFTSLGDDGENKFTSGGLFYKNKHQLQIQNASILNICNVCNLQLS